MSCCDDNMRQHFDRMNEEANQDITRTFDLIDKMKSGEVTGVELDEKSMRIPFKIFPADRLSDDHCVQRTDAIHNAEVAMREKCAASRNQLPAESNTPHRTASVNGHPVIIKRESLSRKRSGV